MENEKFDAWAIVEIFGHQRLAGRVSEQSIGGCSFVRVDIPALDDETPGYTRLFGQGAIYSITLTSKDAAILAARSMKQEPMSYWDLPQDVQARLGREADDEDDNLP